MSKQNEQEESRRYKALLQCLESSDGRVSDDDLEWMMTYEEANPSDPEVIKSRAMENLIIEAILREGSDVFGLGPGIPSEKDRINQLLDQVAPELDRKFGIHIPTRRRKPIVSIRLTPRATMHCCRRDAGIEVQIQGMEEFSAKWLNPHTWRSGGSNGWWPYPLFVTLIDSGAKTGESSWMRGEGEELLYLLQGEGEIHCFNSKPITIKPENGWWINNVLPHRIRLKEKSRLLFAFCDSTQIEPLIVGGQAHKFFISRPLEIPQAIPQGDYLRNIVQEWRDLGAALFTKGHPRGPLRKLVRVETKYAGMAEHQKLVMKQRIIDPNCSYRLGYHFNCDIRADLHTLNALEKLNIDEENVYVGTHDDYEFIYVLKGKVRLRLIPRDRRLIEDIRALEEIEKVNRRERIITPLSIKGEKLVSEAETENSEIAEVLHRDPYHESMSKLFQEHHFRHPPQPVQLKSGDSFGFDASLYYHYPSALRNEETVALFIKWRGRDSPVLGIGRFRSLHCQ